MEIKLYTAKEGGGGAFMPGMVVLIGVRLDPPRIPTLPGRSHVGFFTYQADIDYLHQARQARREVLGEALEGLGCILVCILRISCEADFPGMWMAVPNELIGGEARSIAANRQPLAVRDPYAFTVTDHQDKVLRFRPK